MNSKNAISENSEIFVDLARVICHGPENVMPLHRVNQSSESHVKFGREYTDWVFDSEYSPFISFLDITFFNLQDSKEAWSLIVAPSLAAAQKYEELLNNFITDNKTLAGHEVFRNGLPTFEHIAKSGKIISPENAEELRHCLHNADLRIKSERLLRWTKEAPVIGSTRRDEVRDTPSDFIFVDTYKASTTENRENLFEDVSHGSIKNQWIPYVEMLREHEADFKDASGRLLSLIMATPIGVRTGEAGKDFLPLAHVFFGLGLGGKEGEVKADEFLRMLMLQLYRANGSTYGEIRGQQAAGNSFGHEVKHIATALTDRWTRPAADLFDVEVTPEQQAHDRSKLGKIEIAGEYSWLANELGIIPFKDLINDAGDLIRFWCMLDNQSDIPIKRPDSGFWTLEDFMQECLDLARHTMQPHLLKGESAVSVTALESFRHVRRILIELQVCQPLLITSTDNAASVKVDYKNDLTVWLARVFTAIFKNCVQHGDPLLPIQAKLYFQADKPQRLVVSISNHRRRPTKQLIELLMQRGLSQDDAQSALAYTLAADSGISSLEAEGWRFNSERVVQFCLKKLQGAVENMSAEKANPYFITFSYEITGGDKK